MAKKKSEKLSAGAPEALIPPWLFYPAMPLCSMILVLCFYLAMAPSSSPTLWFPRAFELEHTLQVWARGFPSFSLQDPVFLEMKSIFTFGFIYPIGIFCGRILGIDVFSIAFAIRLLGAMWLGYAIQSYCLQISRSQSGALFLSLLVLVTCVFAMNQIALQLSLLPALALYFFWLRRLDGLQRSQAFLNWSRVTNVAVLGALVYFDRSLFFGAMFGLILFFAVKPELQRDSLVMFVGGLILALPELLNLLWQYQEQHPDAAARNIWGFYGTGLQLDIKSSVICSLGIVFAFWCYWKRPQILHLGVNLIAVALLGIQGRFTNFWFPHSTWIFLSLLLIILGLGTFLLQSEWRRRLSPLLRRSVLGASVVICAFLCRFLLTVDFSGGSIREVSSTSAEIMQMESTTTSGLIAGEELLASVFAARFGLPILENLSVSLSPWVSNLEREERIALNGVLQGLELDEYVNYVTKVLRRDRSYSEGASTERFSLVLQNHKLRYFQILTNLPFYVNKYNIATVVLNPKLGTFPNLIRSNWRQSHTSPDSQLWERQ